jgi:CRP-like cAMP-binding protein
VDELARHPLLASLDVEATTRLAEQVTSRRYKPGQALAEEGDPCREIGFVAQGLVRQRHLSAEGRQHVLAYYGPGSTLNLIAALDGLPHPGTLEALTEVVVYVLPLERFAELAQSTPRLAWALSREMAREVRRLGAMVKDLALHNVRTRLARFLLTHAGDGPTSQAWTQETIAEHIGTVRDVVGRLLRAFAEEGLVRRERGRMVIVDRAALERAAQGE